MTKCLTSTASLHQHPPEAMTDGADVSFHLDGGDAIDALGEDTYSVLKNSQASKMFNLTQQYWT